MDEPCADEGLRPHLRLAPFRWTSEPDLLLADKSLKELAQGQVDSKGGTDLSCVIAHMEKHRIRHAVLITDGCVPCPSNSERKVLENVRLAVVLTPGANVRGPLEGCVDHWEELP